MKQTLQRICELQTAYSSSNTDEMAERGRLIRQVLTEDLRQLLPVLSPSFAEFARDISVEGSDGIGRKTEAPWVRMYDPLMSPSPREGYYIVIHFAADGSCVFLTVGCGSTVWANGDLTAISDGELAQRTSWARSIVEERFGDLRPFIDEIKIGAKAPLPRTFEKATAFAKRYAKDDLDDDILASDLMLAAERLAEIYRAQKIGRDVAPSTQDTNAIYEITRPRRSGQGFGLSAAERKAVELRAMEIANDWLIASGYAVTDVSAREPYDFKAIKDGEILMVEVKGTTSDNCNSILMTRNEIELHRAHKGQTALLIVSSIRLSRDAGEVKASHGKLDSQIAWDVDAWSLDPIAFQVSRTTDQ